MVSIAEQSGGLGWKRAVAGLGAVSVCALMLAACGGASDGGKGASSASGGGSGSESSSSAEEEDTTSTASGGSSSSDSKPPSGGAHGLLRKRAPDMALKLSAGGKFKPSDAKGKVLVLDFWATWCGPCRASFPKLDGLYRKLKGQGVAVVGINEDESSDDVPGFLKATGATFPIALDSKQLLAAKYGVEAMPSTFVIDQQGVVRFVHDGARGDEDAKIEKEVQSLLKASDGGDSE